MGCSATKNLTVEPLDGTQVTHLSTNSQDTLRKASIPRRVSDVPALEGVEPQTEVLEEVNVNNVHKTGNGLSFDIAFDEESGESIIRKHPPKRFQKLEEQQMTPTLSLNRLQEKLDEAETRRQQILQQRVQSAKCRKILMKQNTVYSANNGEYLQIPDDKPDTPFITNSNDTFHLNATRD